ncbi:MAG: secretin N-terminal domain-containing protein [Planctomycetota bacterium]
MPHQMSPRGVVIAALLLAASIAAQTPFELKEDGAHCTLQIREEGMSMTELVKLTERMTGRAFVYSAEMLAAADPVRLVGVLRMEKKAFLPFLQTMAHVRGLAVVAKGEGKKAVLQIVPIGAGAAESDAAGAASKSGQAGKGQGPRFVPADELVSHLDAPAGILTSIELAHIKPQDAINRVRQVLAATRAKVELAHVGTSLMVQGSGADVYCVSRVVRLVDVPPLRVFEVVRLKHAVATRLASGLKAVVGERKPKVVVVADDKEKTLMILGPRELVDEVVEVAKLLDQAAAR